MRSFLVSAGTPFTVMGGDLLSKQAFVGPQLNLALIAVAEVTNNVEKIRNANAGTNILGMVTLLI